MRRRMWKKREDIDVGLLLKERLKGFKIEGKKGMEERRDEKGIEDESISEGKDKKGINDDYIKVE